MQEQLIGDVRAFATVRTKCTSVRHHIVIFIQRINLLTYLHFVSHNNYSSYYEDVFETINMAVSVTGAILRAEVHGRVFIAAYASYYLITFIHQL